MQFELFDFLKPYQNKNTHQLLLITSKPRDIIFGDINQTELCMISCLFHSTKAYSI